MSCTNQVLAGLAKDCDNSMGGIKSVYIANYDDVASVTVTDGKITAIEMADAAKFLYYYFRKGTSSFTSTLTVDDPNGVRYWTTELVMSFLRMETKKRLEISALSANELAVIIQDANGVYWYLGKDEAVTASTADGQSGTARGDGNRYSITLQDTSVEAPYEIDADIIAGLI